MTPLLRHSQDAESNRHPDRDYRPNIVLPYVALLQQPGSRFARQAAPEPKLESPTSPGSAEFTPVSGALTVDALDARAWPGWQVRLREAAGRMTHQIWV